jgi:hypothetical protein
MESSITCAINCKHRVAATLYTQHKRFVSRIYVLVNNLEKITDNNNNNEEKEGKGKEKQ